MRSRPDLAALQRWFQDVVTSPEPLASALAGAAAYRAEEVVVPSSTLEPAERLGIYHRMYQLRLEEVLATDYGATREALGEETFADLCTAYVTAHPSRSFTLARLGDRFPEFLAGRAGAPAWVVDLARLERALAQVEEAPDEPELTEETLAAVPDGAWPGARLVPIAALRLLACSYPVHRTYRAWLHDEPLRPPRRRRTRLLVYRHADRPLHLPLPSRACTLLEALLEGAPLEAALARLPAEPPEQLFAWLRDWVGRGLFRAILLREPAVRDGA